MIRIAFILVYIHICGAVSFSQSISVVPYDYTNPFFYSDDESNVKFENDVLKKPRKRKGEKWYVISDRNDNQIYSTPIQSSKKINKLGFKDLAYVLKDIRGWLLLGASEHDTLGWVPKSNVLQWRRSIWDAGTQKRMKVLVFPRLEKIDLRDLEGQVLYDNPDSISRSIGLLTNDLYFIYKVERDEKGNHLRYLVGSNPKLSSRKLEYLKGWIDAKEVTLWKNNICLEPNFNYDAADERHRTSRFQVKGFGYKRGAELIASGTYAHINSREVFWDGDPVKYVGSYNLAFSSNRYAGDQFRFPIYESNKETYTAMTIAPIDIDEMQSLSGLRMSSSVLGIIKAQLSRIDGERVDTRAVKDMVDQVKFITPIYFPKKQPGQIHNPYLLVLFMPETDLISYVEELDKLSYALDQPKDQARKQLQYLLTDLARKSSAASLAEVSEMEIEEIIDMMVGIEREGHNIDFGMDAAYKLKDLNNKKKFPDEAMIELGDSIIKSTKKLKGIIKSKPPYEFKYSTDENNTYYWIPLEYIII